MIAYVTRNVMTFTWFLAVFFVSSTAPKAPACNTAECNFGTLTSDYCFNSGSCDYPDFCHLAQCATLQCPTVTYGHNHFCVLFSYCYAYPTCNSGCPTC
jgi:hypothetical protein